MARFLYLYSGGTPPADAQAGRAVMQAWMAYMAGLGDRNVAGGGPLGDRRSVGGGAASGAVGFSLVEADNLDHAVALTDGHPHLGMGGAIEVVAVLPIPGG